MKSSHYPYIEKLKLTIHRDVKEGCLYVLSEDVYKVLNKEQSKLFSKYFGAQTCLMTKDGKMGLYPWDVEAVLVRMFRGVLVGTQKYWD